MAMQARQWHHSPDFQSMGGLDEYAGCLSTSPAPAANRDATVLSDLVPGSELTFSYSFMPRKRARVADGGVLLEDQPVVMPPSVTQGLVQPPATVMHGRAAGSGAASTSGREIDALIRFESERMRAELEAARRRHARAVLAAVGRAAAARMCAVESELDCTLRRNAELEEKARQMDAERQAWMGAARTDEAVVAGLRASLDQVLQLPNAAATAATGVCEGEAEDARSCCFEAPAAPSCKSCGGGEACVLLLPCRHLCLCRACEAAVGACPVCAATKNGSLHVLIS